MFHLEIRVSTTTTDWQAPNNPALEEQPNEKGLDFFTAIMGRKFLVVAFIGIGLGLGHLHFTRQPPVFASFAKVMVLRPQSVLPNEDPERGTKKSANAVNLLENHQYLLTQPKILKGAVDPPIKDDASEEEKKHAKEASLSRLASLAASSNPAATIATGLRVIRSEVSEDVLEISYVGPNAGDCKKILDSVLASYKRWLESTQAGNRKVLEEILVSAKGDLDRRLGENRQKYDDFRNTATLIFQDNKGINYYEERLRKIEDERHQKMIALQELQATRNAMKDALSRGASKEALLLMANMLKPNGDEKSDPAASLQPKVDPFMEKMMPLLLERDTLLERVGESHPQVKMLDRKIESLRGLLREEAGAKGSKLDLLSIHLESLDERINAYENEVAQLNSAFDNIKGDALKMQGEQRTNERLNEEHANLKQTYEALVSKLVSLDLAKDAMAMQAEITSEPSPGVQIGPSMVQSLGFGGIGGLLAAIAIALLLETADKSFRNPDEISRQLRLPVIGHIPELAADRDWKMVKDAQVDSSISVHHRPKSRLAESYRAVRAAIFFGTRGQTHRVLQITSANSGDGKTTLCSNLASAIAMSGKKVLLVDGDLRRPRIHKLFGLDLERGLSSVIRDGMDLPDAVQTTLVPNLDVMTVGPRVDNPAELLLSPQFTELVQQLREKYDFVLIDTPPILIVTDPAAVAAHVDGVILVVRNTKRSRPQTRRVRETLDLIGARVLGVVVNGISERAAGYGYGDSYSYNYTTSYRSRSGKYYSDERVGHSYYDDSRKRR
ncbi:hypothetical protein AYO47_06680 [Planctomyces sp. SCGC AG-212-M04]|nr:hypothetical protein AYO47_06680 [Planctomyces sp. SCGC AG-212-M04]